VASLERVRVRAPSARSAIRADAKRLGGTRKIEVLRLTGFHRIRERELTIVVSAIWSATSMRSLPRRHGRTFSPVVPSA
jgi:hypothetical protein